jgi:hypothetical protein
MPRLSLLSSGFLILLLACSHHVMVRDANTSPERRFECHAAAAGKLAPACTRAGEDVPAYDNAGGTVVVALPSECNGRINEVLVRNADSSDPIVLVRCATAKSPVDTLGPTSPDGGP